MHIACSAVAHAHAEKTPVHKNHIGSQNEHIKITNILKFGVGPILNDIQPFKNSKIY